jgi:hypothetical protein
MADARRSWPYSGQATSPPALTQTPDGTLNSGRSLAGPLRLGTAPGVGPRGALDGAGASDFGTDRVSPRRFDPIGTGCERWPRETSVVVSRSRR